MKNLILLITIFAVVACGSGGGSNSTNQVTNNLMASKNLSPLNSIPNNLSGNWYTYDNGTPMSLSIISANNIKISRFGNESTEQMATNQQKNYVITDSQKGSFFIIVNITSGQLCLMKENGSYLFLDREY